MPLISPLLHCWRITADHLPESLMEEQKAPAFTLPGAAELADFADLLGEPSEDSAGDSQAEAADVSAPFALPAMIPDEITGSAVLSCELDFGAMHADHAVMTFDHLSGRGRVMLGSEILASFDTASASFKSISEAAESTALPCMLAVDLTQALQRGKKETLSVCFDDTRPAGVSGPVMLRIAEFGFLSRVRIAADAAQQTITVRTQVNALKEGGFVFRVQPVSPSGEADAARECAYALKEGASLETDITLSLPGPRFAAGNPFRAGAVRLSLSYQKEGASFAFPCDTVTLLCGYGGKSCEYALPLAPQECMLAPDTLIKRLSALHVPSVRLPIPAPDALYRALTRAGIIARMPDQLPLRARLERLPCSFFAVERVGEYAPVSPEASAWQMASMVTMPRTPDASLSSGELLEDIIGRRVDPSEAGTQGVLSWLRAVSIRLRAEAARQGRFSGALCAPGEWESEDICDSLRTAFAPLHISALPLYGAWWSSSRFSAMIHAFIPSGAYSPDDPLIVNAVLEDEEGNELARLRAPCRCSGGHIGVLEAQLPDHACVLQLTTQLILHDGVLEESSFPVYVGERGPLEAAFA